MNLQVIVKQTILRTVTGTNEVPEDALVAAGWSFINNGDCTESEWFNAVDEAINDLLDEGVMRSTLIDAGTPVKSLYKGMIRFIPAITRVEAPAPVQTVNEPVKTEAVELDAERIETLLVLTQDDETDSPLELMLQAKYGKDCTRHGSYDIVLEYNKKLKAIARWTNDTPEWIKKELLTNLDAFQDATQMISQYYAKAIFIG